MYTEQRKATGIPRDVLLSHGITEAHLRDSYNLRPQITFGNPAPYSSELPVTFHASWMPRFTFGPGGLKSKTPMDNYTLRIGCKTITYINVAAGTPSEEVIREFTMVIKKESVLANGTVQEYLKRITDAYRELNASVEIGTSVRRRLDGLSIRLMDIAVGVSSIDLTPYTERKLGSLGYDLDQLLPSTVSNNALLLVNAIESSWALHHDREGMTMVRNVTTKGGSKLRIVIGDHESNYVVIDFNRCVILDKDTLIPTPEMNSVLNDFT